MRKYSAVFEKSKEEKMVDHRLTDEEKNLLKSLIGSRLVSFTAEKIWENKFTPSYWIDLKTEISLVKIENVLVPTVYLSTDGDIEDVTRFSCKLASKEKTNLVDYIEKPARGTISDIILVDDTIAVRGDHDDFAYDFVTTEGIVIKTEDSAFAISRGWHLMEVMLFEETLDYEKAIYPVAEVIEDWALTEDACDDPFYTTTATCDRKFISLKDGGEIAR